MTRRAVDYGFGVIAVVAFSLLLIENTPVGDAFAGPLRAANVVILLIFTADVLYRLLWSPVPRTYLKRHWFDLIVLVPFIQFIRGIENIPFFVIVRQVVIVMVLIARGRRLGRLVHLLSLRPAQVMITGFAMAIAFGTVLLMLPAAVVGGVRTSLVDAAFTATSAVCVTGLIVKDTATHFTAFGQMVILVMIQAGGLGIMTFSVSLAVLLRRQLDVKQRAALQDALDYDTLAGVRRLIRFIFTMALSFELAGAVALFLLWRGRFSSPLRAAYHAAFHSVSAFCNAGFSTFSDSLMGFRDSIGTNVVICALIIGGGLGFMVIRDLLREGGERLGIPWAAVQHSRVQTRIVLTVSLVLIVGGAMFVYAAERWRLLGDLPRGQAALACLFQSVTSRTAGFNTLDVGQLSAATLLVTMVLMFIGGSPGSTAGGIKTTTLAVLSAAVASGMRSRQHVEIYRRTIPHEVVQKAVAVAMMSLLIVALFTFLLLHVESKPLQAVLFETVSAFGTVGLSTGITPTLTTAGKALVAILMFIGRLGPLTVVYALMRTRRAGRYEYAEERVMIG